MNKLLRFLMDSAAMFRNTRFVRKLLEGAFLVWKFIFFEYYVGTIKKF